MSQTLRNRCDFLPSMRRLYASGDLAQPNSIRQCADRPLIRSERPLKLLPHSPDLACAQSPSWHRANITPVINIGTNIKSP